VGLVLDLAFAVAAQDVAVAAQPEVAFAVEVGLVRAAVLASVELDHHALLALQAVDRPGPDLLVALGQLDPSAPRRRGVATVITEGGAAMMRQRQAAVPWLRSAPSLAASRAATSHPSSVSSSGATFA
jgi:hypothetical protein